MRRFYPETFLVALAVILLEVSYTRVFSYKLVYYFTYLVIGISLLGLGAGGVFFAISERLRRVDTGRLVMGCCVGGGAAVLVGYFVVATIELRLFEMLLSLPRGVVLAPLWQMAKLTFVLLALFVPFLAAGIALATIFATRTENIASLYAADLLGAALGAALVIPLLFWISPPGTVLLSGAAFALGALSLAREAGGRWSGATMALLALSLLGAAFPGVLPDPVRDPVKGGDSIPALHSRWSPVFRVDVAPVPGADPPTSALIHDGTIGSTIISYDGNPGSLGRYDTEERAYPFRLLGSGARVAIIGSAGGNEIFASLRFGADRITGVELNPVTVSLLRNEYLDYTGRIAEHEKVTIVNAEGRSFLSGSDQEFDLVWLVAPDSYAAVNAASAGAFVLSESYLYTQEMFEEAFAHLSPDGIVCAQFGELDYDTKPNRVVRYLGTAREALASFGIEDFDRHVLVAVSPGFGRLATATILVKRSPFTDGDIATFLETTEQIPGAKASFTWRQESPHEHLRRVIVDRGADLAAFHREYPYRVQPITDDAPFFWHFVDFRDALASRMSAHDFNAEEGLGEQLLIVFLLAATILAAVFLLAPLVFLRGVWREIPYKLNSALYFAALGLGFMFLEVCLIQRLTLFLGYPTYSLTITLFSLLLSTGVGSLLSERWAAARNRAYVALLLAVALLVAFYELLLPPIVEAGVGWALPVRIAVTVTMLFPLGLCLGAFLPLGLQTVSRVTRHGQEYVAWCWAVNGFFSVVASVLSTVLSMTFGFGAVMLIGLVLYAIGVAAFSRVPEPGGPTSA